MVQKLCLNVDAIVENLTLDLRLGRDSGRDVFRPRVVNTESSSFDDVTEVNERRQSSVRLKVLCSGQQILPQVLNFLPFYLRKPKGLAVGEDL